MHRIKRLDRHMIHAGNAADIDIRQASTKSRRGRHRGPRLRDVEIDRPAHIARHPKAPFRIEQDQQRDWDACLREPARHRHSGAGTERMADEDDRAGLPAPVVLDGHVNDGILV